MARVPLKYLDLHPTVRGVADREGSIYIYQPGTTTEATVYNASTAGSAITQPITFSAVRFTHGWIEAGEYDVATSSSKLTQPVDLTAGDAQLGTSPSDDGLSVYNVCPQECIPSVSATTTSQTIKFVRIVPDKKITAAQVVLVSGTAAA